ncbi:SubName: Full=Related to coenzyme A diphosphatase {ECO:0000313/EMBL:CCA68904.1} [Serendipita indica DSM 11827]|nr:SubName: Full=Related to coenzyme A diphosphatase {ECO:0000313/EMBL:CCA68904.1} [Serendipita indica DSM 11827]
MALRSHPGQTAFPGGKCDPQDANVKETALREAHEECGLDPKSPALHYIGQLPPYLSQWKLVVTPVLFFLDDPSVLASLVPCTQEVDRIFTHPLQAILDPELASDEVLSRKGSDDWPYEEELYASRNLLALASPIKGLTSDVLIRVAQIAYEAEPTYQRYGPGQPTHTQFVAWALEDLSSDTTTRIEVNGTMESTAYASREVDGAQ